MKKFPVALQLFSVRDFAEKDLPHTLSRVKAMGYDLVELAGTYGHDAAAFRSALDDAGLKAISAHVPLQELQEDTEAAVLKYKAIGCRYIAVPYLGEGLRPGDNGFDDVLTDIARIGEICRQHDIILLYHNHDFEFVRMPDGSFGFDYMYEKIPADLLKTEIDTCWVKVAGQDPTAYLRKYAGRAPVVHLKDFRGSKTENMYELIGTDEKKAESNGVFEFRPVGYGVQDFPAILAAAEDAGAEYVVVEQDMSLDCPSLEAAEKSRKYLAALGL